MNQKRRKPKKSLRTLLMLWFLLFSVVPLAFITGYSLVKYEQAIDQELSQRLKANSREIGVIISDFETGLLSQARQLANDSNLIFHMSKNGFSAARQLAQERMRSHYAHRLWLHNREGRLEVALYRDEDGKIQRRPNIEGGPVELKGEFLDRVKEKDELTLVDFRSQKDGEGRVVTQSVDLTVFLKLKNSKGRTVGYLEEVISLDEGFRSGLKNRLNLEVFFFEKQGEEVFSSHTDLRFYKANFFRDYLDDTTSAYFDLVIQDVPYGFRIHPVYWGDTEFYIGLGASKSASRAILQNVNYAFFSVVGAIILLLVVLSVISSKIMLRPLYELLNALQSMDVNKGKIEIQNAGETELGLLAESFNEMSQRVYRAQQDLKGKVEELEQANAEIRETQARLVHTAKMASLGQLVAGIAHELNNPIGFIYSNMSHLDDYSNKLVGLVQLADKSPNKLKAEMEKVDFDYIVEDLPKLIRSCEDGARRTRDIVLGLRSFSRLEEAQIKEVDVREGLEDTLKLLTGEFKNRIKIVKNFSEVPNINCYPSQLNQVFMNILSNAGQAIEGEGEITIETGTVGSDKVFVIIRDSGKGMAQSTIDQIFDPFFTTKSLGKGTGLGLSISYGIVEKHGGEIQVESELGKGTQFKIILPVAGPA
ncbi:MAG: two-component sensor histidine kinase [Bdellovibrionaceae bacterium]|nr:two-component sensor histidine kinase [Bdellovibrionales bacterium]MCB9086207.1 two-component sensor histidine kinase [Pseudobdellovibrionaceae bacterium]